MPGSCVPEELEDELEDEELLELEEEVELLELDEDDVLLELDEEDVLLLELDEEPPELLMLSGPCRRYAASPKDGRVTYATYT